MNRPEEREVLKKHGAFLCVECGKCVALCPMAETAQGFNRERSPRGVVQQALRGMDAILGLESCLQCRSCSQVCPAGVDVAALIADLRRIRSVVQSVCPLCGAPMLPADAEKYVDSAVNAGFEGRISYAQLCPECRRRAYIRNNS